MLTKIIVTLISRCPLAYLQLITVCLFVFISEPLFAYEFFISSPAAEPYKTLDITFFETSFRGKPFTYFNLPSIQFFYGILPDVDIQLLLYYQFHSFNVPGLASANGIGDITITSTYCFLHESRFWPEMAIEPAYLIPTGNYNVGLGNGKPIFTFPLYVQKNWGPLALVLGVGYNYNSAPFTY